MHFLKKKKAPSGGENLHFSRFLAIFGEFSWEKLHLGAKKWTKPPSGGQNLHFSRFSAVYLLSQFCKQTADFSVFSCLFTFQLFVYFLSFVNKQLFVYISQQNPGFGFFVPSWPQSNASTRSQLLTAVCLHFDSCLFTFDSCLFTFSQFFVNKQLTLFTFFSCLFTFSQFL